MKGTYDIIVVGTGIAGLSYLTEVKERNPSVRVAVISKASREETNTRYAQGGIAGVFDFLNDSYEEHIRDTLIAGAGKCDPFVVELTVREGPSRIKKLIVRGVEFDRDREGRYKLAREGGHSKFRILHHKDKTGITIEKALLKNIKQLGGIDFFDNHLALELIRQDGNVYGLSILSGNTGKIKHLFAPVTLFATGGAGQVYQITTNPEIATGDGIAIAGRGGATIGNMEYIQFHPTALYNPGESPAFLISEAVRGQGAILRDTALNDLMKGQHPQGSLAPRDIVARAIHGEILRSGKPHVYLDISPIPPEKFRREFPVIAAKCRKQGIDIREGLIPVAPAAHYLCGGIKTDIWGQTSLPGLFAIGECSFTGLHGANRLASNSLLEALVFAHRAAITSLERTGSDLPDNLRVPQKFRIPGEAPEKFKNRIREIMTEKAGIKRNTKDLSEALEKLLTMQDTLIPSGVVTPGAMEATNLLETALYIVKASITNKESCGLHFLEDVKLPSEVIS